MAFTKQAYSENTGDVTSAALVCRLVIPVGHLLTAAWVYTTEVVTTGTLEVRLKKVDPRDARGGSDVAELINNDDVTPRSATVARYDFVLLDFAKALAPAERTYFVSILGTNAADRFNEPLLVVKYDLP